MRKGLPPTATASGRFLLKQKPERQNPRLCVIKENLGTSWLRTVLRSPPCSPSGRVTLEGRIRAEMRPASTRWELARATPRWCGSPVRTPPRLPGAPTATQGKLCGSTTGRFAWCRPHKPGLCHLLCFWSFACLCFLRKCQKRSCTCARVFRGYICPPAVAHSHAEPRGTECILARPGHFATLPIMWLVFARPGHAGSRVPLRFSVGFRGGFGKQKCERCWCGWDGPRRRFHRGKRTEQATNSAGLWAGAGMLCRGEAKARTRKLRRPSPPPRSYPLRPPRGSPRARLGLAGARGSGTGSQVAGPVPPPARRVRSASGRSAAAVPAVLAATAAAGTSGSRRKGTPPRLCPRRPSALRESGRRRSHRGRPGGGRRRAPAGEKFVGPEPSAPPRKPARLKQAGDEA